MGTLGSADPGPDAMLEGVGAADALLRP